MLFRQPANQKKLAQEQNSSGFTYGKNPQIPNSPLKMGRKWKIDMARQPAVTDSPPGWNSDSDWMDSSLKIKKGGICRVYDMSA
jgi:hypothetical protein